jgi:hypothetical protein
MASETFKKRQKEAARREKQQKKTARPRQMEERRNEKAKTGTKISEANPESVSRRGPTIL